MFMPVLSLSRLSGSSRPVACQGFRCLLSLFDFCDAISVSGFLKLRHCDSPSIFQHLLRLQSFRFRVVVVSRLFPFLFLCSVVYHAVCQIERKKASTFINIIYRHTDRPINFDVAIYRPKYLNLIKANIDLK